jgi:hypothetical protein
VNNQRKAEILGIEHCVKYVIGHYAKNDIFIHSNNTLIINIYTDCQSAWKYDFNSIVTNLTKNKIQLNLIKIKEHQKKCDMNEHDLIFKKVDKHARKILRTQPNINN